MTLPNVWPWFNLINLINFDIDKARNIKYNGVSQFLLKYFALSTYIFIAYISSKYTFPTYNRMMFMSENKNYYIFYKFYIKWLLIISMRDQIIGLFFYGSWHYILYESSISKKIKSIKFNPKYPDKEQWRHDRFYTMNGIFISSFYELFIIYYFQTHPHLLQNNIYSRLLPTVLWFWCILYFRGIHFYITHRMMHPWNKEIFGIDFGKYIYKYVHSLHHKSYNTGPYSGLSMHPIEHLIFFSCILFPICCNIFIQHPIHILFNKYHSILAPLPAHDGFDIPGGGNYFHYLHHAHFECNYGASDLPFDSWFGTLDHGKKYEKKKTLHHN